MSKEPQRNSVYLIDSRGVVASENEDALQRHFKYAHELCLANNSRFIIITASNYSNSNNYKEYFRQYFINSNKRFSFVYILRAVRIIIKSKEGNSILIAGDPWESAINARIIAVILKKFFKIYAPIQVQIHADVTDPIWKSRSVINEIRYHSLNLSLKKIAQIRVVSESMRNGIISKYLLPSEQVIIAPVELNLPNKSTEIYSCPRPRSIGFAGRFHKDRGITDFINYVRKVDPDGNNINVTLAGDGPLLEYTLSQLKEIVNPARIEYCGNLSPDEMQVFWHTVGVYVSLAKSESYGRSIREAAYLGIPIVGAKSNGFDQLRQVDVSWICEIESLEDPNALISQLECMFKVQTDDSVRTFLEAQSKKNMNILIDSWIKLLGNDHVQ